MSWAMTHDAWGIADGYEDTLGAWHPLDAETRLALLAAMGVEPAGLPSESTNRPLVIRRGESPAIARGEVTLEDGATLAVHGTLPADLPLGYHHLYDASTTAPRRLIVAPRRCHLLAGRLWGWAAQVYATRSSESWGIGDLADLHRLLANLY